MLKRSRTPAAVLVVAFVFPAGGPAPAAAYQLSEVNVVVPQGASPMVRMAGDELCRYVCLLTGSLPRAGAGNDAARVSIVLQTGAGDRVAGESADPEQNYALYARGRDQVVHGASDVATLWAAYHLVESWGAGFYLGGDALPKPDTRLAVELVEATGRPALKIRGNLPWFNFMNSPTTWNPQDYKTFFAQMVKQKANFIGFHAYDHEPFGGYDITPDKATMGGPLMTTISAHRWWSPPAMATSDFLFGTDQFFDRGEWGCEVGIEDAWTWAPGRATALQQKMMGDALGYARRIGLRTCIGWEVTGNPDDPKVKEAFQKRLAHTVKTYPIDYFWAWQSEGRGTAGAGGNWVAGAPNDASIKADEEIAKAFAYLGADHDLREAVRITRYVRLAHAELQRLAPKARLVVSGWGGDAWMRFSSLYIGLDKVVPDDVIFAALDNIDPRLQPNVSEAYGKVKATRERWPIPWFESDGGHTRIDQTGPQTNVTAFEPLLKDIVAKKCQGALGIHWRSRNVEDVAGYLYRFGWNANLTAAEFFKGYAREHYGPKDAERMTQVHLRLEEFGPQYVGAVGTVECGTPFWWFNQSGSADKGREPNRAGHMPDAGRFPELEKLASELDEKSRAAASDGRAHAAQQYDDLGGMIEWLVIRAKVGLAIWGDAPLEKRLQRAEGMLAAGKVKEAREAARGVLADLEKLDFRRAVQALASTCRTRGELGMLATAVSRYGRFYASFVQRIAQITGEPLPTERGTERWRGQEVLTVMPVPGQIATNETACFDAVLLPARPRTRFHIELKRLSGQDDLKLPLVRLGGSYHRATFFPPGEGLWAWSLVPDGRVARPSDALPLASGVICVRPASAGAPVTMGPQK